MAQILPVCIVGAGPAGLVAANLLGQLGIPVVLLERHPGTSELPRAIILDDEAMRTCESLDLVEEVAARMRWGLRAQYFSVQARDYTPALQPFAEILPPVGVSGFEQLGSFLQPEMEQVWLSGLARYPHVEVHFRASFEGFEERPEGLLVTWRDADGQVHSLPCAYLLGCDGGHSSVREAAGIRIRGSSFAQPWLVLDIRHEERDRRAFRFYCDPPRPSMDGPGPGDFYRYEFMMLPGERPEEMLRDEVLAELVRYDRVLHPRDIVRKAVYTFHAMTAERFRQGRVFLLGDAAHMLPPFAGQGLNSCLRDALNLCWKLAGVMRGQLDERILDTYEQERRPNVEGMIKTSVLLGNIVMATNTLRKLVRNVLFGVINTVPTLRRNFRDFQLKPPAKHARGLYVGLGRSSGRVRTGWLLPQPRVRCPDGGERLLDEALGSGFALVVAEAGASERPVVLGHPLWKRLAPREVHVVTAAQDGAPSSRENVFIDAQGQLGLAPGQAALVRPDRFVAGVFPVEEADAFAERLARLC